MAQVDGASKPGVGQRMQSMPKQWLFVLLAGSITLMLLLFQKLELPKKPEDSTIDLFASLMQLPEGSTVLLQSDWTVSTRGENGGAMESLLRILMRKNVKFAFYTSADPQAPQVARDAIMRINKERKEAGEREYKGWEDFVDIGYYPNAEGLGQAMATNLKTAWAGKQNPNSQGQPEDVFKSPVLQNVTRVEDAAMLIDVTASQTIDILVERLSKKVKLAMFVTGVMGPESTVYYRAKQIVGVSIGLGGCVDMEKMMEKGIEPEGKNGAIPAPGRPTIAGFPGQKNIGRAMSYYPALHIAMGLMILAIIVGNVGMVLSRKEGKA